MERRQKVERKKQLVGAGTIDSDGEIRKDGRNHQRECACVFQVWLFVLNNTAGCEAKHFSGFSSFLFFPTHTLSQLIIQNDLEE